MIYTDYHTHTSLSPDSEADIDGMIKSAIEKGVDEIAFTEHMDYNHPTFGDFTADIDKQNKIIKEKKEEYKGQITILRGVEVGLRREARERIDKLLNENEFDVVIGSAHIIDGLDLVNGEYFKGKTQREAYFRYFEEMLDLVKEFKNFNFLGHLDFISRYAKYPGENFDYYRDEEIKALIDEIFKELISTGRGIEVNTSGIRYGLAKTLPRVEVLKRYRELGGEIITITSDSHKAEDIGYEYYSNLNVLYRLGFEKIVTFRNKVPRFHSIELNIKEAI